LRERLVRLGAEVPFRRAAALFALFTGVAVSEATARRATEAAGAVAVAVAEVARLERDAPAPPPGPAVQQLSVDGAMVPLVGGVWAEVKTLVVGTVAVRAGAPGGTRDGSPRLTEPSYVSRLADHATFARAALVETHRRGTETAGVVVGVTDGAAWCQGFLDRHRPDAVRVLDFPHAVEHLAVAAQATLGAGTPALAAWLGAQAQALRQAGPAGVLAALRALPVATAADPGAARAARDACLGYIERRAGQMAYPDFVARGFPIGSGAVESANKLVVEARLKGAGMHWARHHVDPVLALREAICSGRWEPTWDAAATELRATAASRSTTRRRARRAVLATGPDVVDIPGTGSMPATDSVPAPLTRGVANGAIPRTRAAGPPTIVNRTPTASHPWKQTFRHRPSVSPPATPEL
jgi:hypothetical protein